MNGNRKWFLFAWTGLVLPALLTLSIVLPSPAAAETITLRSGNGVVGAQDTQIKFVSGGAAAPLSPVPFTVDMEFNSACNGVSAMIVAPYPGWMTGLACDPTAKWISVNSARGPASALYCHLFDVATCCIKQATLSFCWGADDRLGDTESPPPNPAGVYINNVAVAPMISGGGFGTESQVGPIDITALVHCGLNSMHVYNRDLFAVVSGVIFSATINITECPVSTQAATWSQIKALYE